MKHEEFWKQVDLALLDYSKDKTERNGSPMTEQNALEYLENIGAIREGHFVLSGGDHTDRYIDKYKVLFSLYAKDFYLAIAWRFRGRGIEAAVGPVSGGALVAKGVAFHLSMIDGSNVVPVQAEKNGDGDFFIGGLLAPLIKGKKALVVDDVLTTGRSARKTLDLVREHSGQVVGVGAILNRGGDRPKMTINVGREELAVLVEIAVRSWSEKDCELCKSGVPVNTELGHGREFLARKDQRQEAV